MKWKKLILIGASNVQYVFSPEGRWSSLLSNYLQRKCDVINRGYAGFKSGDLKKVVPAIFEEFDPKLICGVIILIGSNDCAHDRDGPVSVICLAFSRSFSALL